MHVDHSIFVGDLAPEVTDYMLQEHFRQYYPSVRSAKVSSILCMALAATMAASVSVCAQLLSASNTVDAVLLV